MEICHHQRACFLDTLYCAILSSAAAILCTLCLEPAGCHLITSNDRHLPFGIPSVSSFSRCLSLNYHSIFCPVLDIVWQMCEEDSEKGAGIGD